MTSFKITALGAQGDGISEADGRIAHIAYALPGEDAVPAAPGHLPQISNPSPDRIAPFCPHFGRCGGCKMQHLAKAPYLAWKRNIVIQALAREGITTEVAPAMDAHGAGRRRVTLHAKFERGVAQAGFMIAKTHDLIDLDRCPVLVPALQNAPEIARAVIRPLSRMGKPVDVQLTASEAGLDVDLRGPGKEALTHRLALSELAVSLDLARLSLHGEIIVERRAPIQRMGQALVNPPAGGFLQATSQGEETLAALVSAALGKAKKVADLFSGAGPFALRLAEKRAVTAIDSYAAAIDALDRAVRAAPGLRQVKAEARDLFRRPLLPHEIEAFDAVVLDPPRAGAEAQVRQIARSKGRHVVYVSCDPQSFARDCRILTAAGFTLARVTPVDQFAHSAHIEIVGLLTRG